MRILRALASLALVPYALRGVGALVIMALVGLAVISGLALLLTEGIG
jgi:hypothetical protein